MRIKSDETRALSVSSPMFGGQSITTCSNWSLIGLIASLRTYSLPGVDDPDVMRSRTAGVVVQHPQTAEIAIVALQQRQQASVNVVLLKHFSPGNQRSMVQVHDQGIFSLDRSCGCEVDCSCCLSSSAFVIQYANDHC